MRTQLVYDWKVENKYHYRSPEAHSLVSFTIDKLSEYIRGTNKTITKEEIPQAKLTGGLASSLLKKRNASGLEHKFTNIPSHITEQKANLWPSPQEFNEAIQTPGVVFQSPDLKRCTVEITDLGLPRPITGAFASVYRVHSDKGTWAVKCFLREVHDQAERYQLVSDCLHNCNLDYTIGFDFIAEGITFAVTGTQF